MTIHKYHQRQVLIGGISQEVNVVLLLKGKIFKYSLIILNVCVYRTYKNRKCLFTGNIPRFFGLFPDYRKFSRLSGYGRAPDAGLEMLESGLLQDYSRIIDDAKMVGSKKK